MLEVGTKVTPLPAASFSTKLNPGQEYVVAETRQEPTTQVVGWGSETHWRTLVRISGNPHWFPSHIFVLV